MFGSVETRPLGPGLQSFRAIPMVSVSLSGLPGYVAEGAMSRTLLFLLPALVGQVQGASLPGAVEVLPGVFVLRGTPSEDVYAGLRAQRFSRVIDLRRDGEPNLDCDREASRLAAMDVQYIRYAISRTPPAGDFDFLRSLLRDLPRGSKVLIHCDDGNRAAAVACSWLVLDTGLPVEEALKLGKTAGLKFPETEDALRRYLRAKGRV